MRAFLLDGLRQLVITRFGEVAGATIDGSVRMRKGTQDIVDVYVDVVREFLGVDSRDALLQLFGDFWINKLLATRPRHVEVSGLAALLLGVDELNCIHAELEKVYAGQSLPRLSVTPPAGGHGHEARVTLTYIEDAYMPIGVGLVRALARMFVGAADVQGTDTDAHTVVVRLRRKSAVDADLIFASKFAIENADVDKLFPFHVAFDAKLNVVQVGSKLCTACPALALNTPLLSQFHIDRPVLGASVTAEALADTLDAMHTWTVQGAVRLRLNGQLAYFAQADLFVLLATPTWQSLRQSCLTLLDVPPLSRVAELPFHLNITEQALDATTTAPVDALQLPSTDVLKGCTDAAFPKDSRIMVLQLERENSVSSRDDKHGHGHGHGEPVDVTTPVQKLVNALQALRDSVPTDTRAHIDAVMRELRQSYDVYLPSLPGKIKQDKEITNYMATFFPRQSHLKFNIQPRINRSVSMAARRGSPHLTQTRSSGLTATISQGREGEDTVGALGMATKSGWLNKESSTNARSWRLRYFVLSGQYLYYYRSDAMDATPLAVINLADFNVIKKVTRKSATCIELSRSRPPTPHEDKKEGEEIQQYYLYADEPAETKAWIDALLDTYAELKIKADVRCWSSDTAALPSKTDRSRSIVETEAVRIALPRLSLGPDADWLRRLGNLDFNVFELAQMTNERPLQFLGKAVLQNTGVLEKFNVAETQLDNFLRVIERGYRKENPYHNAYHAADVTQTLYYFLYTLGVAQYLGEREIFAAVIAAIIHDFMHPGINNAYLINKRAPEAMLYNDQSVLENMHLAKAFQVLADPDCNVFAGMRDDDYRHVRTLIIQMVLNTDMSLHFELMGKFRSAVILLAERPTGEIPPSTIMLILSMAIHCADVSNPCKPLPMYEQWASRVMREFWHQGDLERDANQPISPMCDRNTTTLEKCQTSFINFIVEPLYETFAELVPDLHDECIVNLHHNKAHYAAMLQAEQKPPS